MKNIFLVKLAVFVPLLIILQGCGAVLEMRGAAVETGIVNVKPNLDEQAKKSDVFNRVNAIAVADISESLEGYPQDNILIYRAMTSELFSLL